MGKLLVVLSSGHVNQNTVQKLKHQFANLANMLKKRKALADVHAYDVLQMKFQPAQNVAKLTQLLRERPEKAVQSMNVTVMATDAQLSTLLKCKSMMIRNVQNITAVNQQPPVPRLPQPRQQPQQNVHIVLMNRVVSETVKLRGNIPTIFA
jgi:hypothetical protein